MDSTTTTSLHALGVTASLILSGIATGSSLLTLPILYRLPSATAVDIWSEFFNRGFAIIVPLNIAGTAGLATAAYLDESKRKALATAAVLVVGTLAWTSIVMAGGINRLLLLNGNAAELQRAGSSEVVDLLKAWSWQNGVRAVMYTAGGLLGLYELIK
jgi:hypothetical protein